MLKGGWLASYLQACNLHCTVRLSQCLEQEPTRGHIFIAVHAIWPKIKKKTPPNNYSVQNKGVLCNSLQMRMYGLICSIIHILSDIMSRAMIRFLLITLQTARTKNIWTRNLLFLCVWKTSTLQKGKENDVISNYICHSTLCQLPPFQKEMKHGSSSVIPSQSLSTPSPGCGVDTLQVCGQHTNNKSSCVMTKCTHLGLAA